MSQPDQPMQPAPTATAERPPTMTVVIPSHNNLPDLIKCLKSIYRTAWNYGQQSRLEIIVQDDCSTDFNITDVLYGEPAQCQRNQVNLGFAGNCNAGALRAHGDVLMFLNQDTIARDGWFEPLMDMFQHHANIGIIGPKLVIGDAVQSCGGLYGGNRGPFHRYLGWSADDWRVNVREKVSWMTGAALAVRRELFFKVGGFDVVYERGYFEDVDLCEKVKEAGFEIWYCPESVFEHKVGSSGGIPAHIFKANSLKFHARWDAKIKPDTAVAHVAY